MGSKVPHPAKAFGTGISSIDNDADFRKCKEECEKEDPRYESVKTRGSLKKRAK